MMGITDIPLSLYLHFPWCVRKCPYCDFNSHTLRGDIPEQVYIEALLKDLDWELAQNPEPRPLVSIFMGGGTPSLFSGAAMDLLLQGVRRRLSFAPDIEITLEANPGTAEAGHFRAYREAGINRLSIGVQSLDDRQLKALGRIHGRDEALRAYEVARAAGFDNINLDMMFALPGQTPDEAQTDLASLIALGPEHISYYQLTLEPNTEFARRPPVLPDGDAAWQMQDAGQAQLAAAGYAQYEISAYAQPRRQALHNRNYWRFGDYLGIGAGAHGKRTGAQIERRARQKHPQTYLRDAGTAAVLLEQRPVTLQELPFEYALNAFRLIEGFDFKEFIRMTGQPHSLLEPGLLQARQLGLVDETAERVRATERGWRHLNRLVGCFL